jgi:hypothetical protein
MEIANCRLAEGGVSHNLVVHISPTFEMSASQIADNLARDALAATLRQPQINLAPRFERFSHRKHSGVARSRSRALLLAVRATLTSEHGVQRHPHWADHDQPHDQQFVRSIIEIDRRRILHPLLTRALDSEARDRHV